MFLWNILVPVVVYPTSIWPASFTGWPRVRYVWPACGLELTRITQLKKKKRRKCSCSFPFFFSSFLPLHWMQTLKSAPSSRSFVLIICKPSLWSIVAVSFSRTWSGSFPFKWTLQAHLQLSTKKKTKENRKKIVAIFCDFCIFHAISLMGFLCFDWVLQ